MVKPMMKREVAIDSVIEWCKTIYFFATSDAASDFTEYGNLMDGKMSNHYRLEVDGRWDFGEIVNYMRNYDSQNSESLFGE